MDRSILRRGWRGGGVRLCVVMGGKMRQGKRGGVLLRLEIGLGKRRNGMRSWRTRRTWRGWRRPAEVLCFSRPVLDFLAQRQPRLARGR
jgi:hypothetical protein